MVQTVLLGTSCDRNQVAIQAFERKRRRVAHADLTVLIEIHRVVRQDTDCRLCTNISVHCGNFNTIERIVDDLHIVEQTDI